MSVIVGDMRQGSSYGERTRGVASSSPAPATVEAETLILDDLEDATALEGLGVCLTLDLEDVEGQQHDLTNTNQTNVTS